MSATKIGFFAWAGAIIILLFQGISGLMKFNASWSAITLGGITGGMLDQYIEKIPSEFLVDWVGFIVNTMELSIVLGIVGLIFIIIGAFKKT
jgi:hypothetical protein